MNGDIILNSARLCLLSAQRNSLKTFSGCPDFESAGHCYPVAVAEILIDISHARLLLRADLDGVNVRDFPDLIVA